MASFQHRFTLAGFISGKKVTFESPTIIYFIDNVFVDTISPTDIVFCRQFLYFVLFLLSCTVLYSFMDESEYVDEDA